MSDVTDYVGRTFDVLAYAGAEPTGDIVLQQELADETSGGQICTGVQKLAQVFLLELLTERGSMRFQPTAGCDFMTRLRRGELRTVMDVYAAFSAALLDIRANLLDYELDDDPDDEKYESATIQSITLLPGSIAIYCKITTLAGDSRTAILPISVTLRG